MMYYRIMRGGLGLNEDFKSEKEIGYMLKAYRNGGEKNRVLCTFEWKR